LSALSQTPKIVRFVAGCFLVGVILYTANLATRDCTVGLYVYENCLWNSFKEFLGLPASKFLRAGFLGLIGLALAAGLYFTFRYVFPPWRAMPVVTAKSQERTADSNSN
jgi:hypothetical protein